MNKPHRLFDCIDQQLQKGGVQGMLVAKENGQWRKYSTQEVKDIVDKLSAGLIALGVPVVPDVYMIVNRSSVLIFFEASSIC